MVPLKAMLLGALMISSAPLPIEKAQCPVVHWRAELFKVLDDPHAPVRQTADGTKHEPAFAPPTRPFERDSWGPKLEMFVNKGQQRLAPAEVTIVNDDDVVVLNGLSLRIHCWRAVELIESRERPLEESPRIEYVFNPGILTSANGNRADFAQMKALEPMDGPDGFKRPPEERPWTWIATGMSVSCDHADANIVSVAELKLAHQLIACQAAHVGVYSERAFPITAQSWATTSFWIGPRQTAVVRLPRVSGDGGETFALVKVFLAGEAATLHARSGAKPLKSSQSTTLPAPVSTHLPLLEVP